MNWLSTWFCVKIQSYTNIRDIRYSRSKKGWCSMLLPKAEQELAGLSSSRIICKKTPNYSALYRPRPNVSGYFWIHNVFFPRRPSFHTHPVLIRTVWIRSPGWKVLNPLHVSGYAWCNKIDPSSLPTVNTVFTWQPLLMLCYQYSQRSPASTVFQALR